jgi:hypothetical protein
LEPYETYMNVVVALGVALLLITAGLGKKQLDWKRPTPLPIRRRRRKP